MEGEISKDTPITPEKKKLSTGSIIGLGCAGGCFLLFVAFAGVLLIAPTVISRIFSEENVPTFLENWIESSIEKDTGEDVNVDLDLNDDKSTLTYEDEVGETTIQYGDDLDYPGDFPTDVPVYKGATVVGKTATPSGSTLTLESSDSYATVVAYFKDQLEDQGWEVLSSYEAEMTAILSYKKGERELSVTLYESSETEGGTSFSIVYGTEQ